MIYQGVMGGMFVCVPVLLASIYICMCVCEGVCGGAGMGWGLGEGEKVRLCNRGGVGVVPVSIQKTDR